VIVYVATLTSASEQFRPSTLWTWGPRLDPYARRADKRLVGQRWYRERVAIGEVSRLKRPTNQGRLRVMLEESRAIEVAVRRSIRD